MRPTTACDDNVFDFNALLHPGTVFDHPNEVVANPRLSLAEKRAILASWASDASAIASCPALRAPQGLKAPVSIDAILEALLLQLPLLLIVLGPGQGGARRCWRRRLIIKGDAVPGPPRLSAVPSAVARPGLQPH